MVSLAFKWARQPPDISLWGQALGVRISRTAAQGSDPRQHEAPHAAPVQRGARSMGGFMLGGRSWDSWIAEYAEGHQHPVNRLTHTVGIPIIILSGPVALAGIFWHRLLWVALGLFVLGWVLQFIGHAVEGKPPEFFKDWRFLLVGSRWWAAKMRGKA